MNATLKLHDAGQSVWFDNIQRVLRKDGELAGMVARGEIRGVTSNPTIFMNAITKSQDYAESLLPLANSTLSAEEIYFNLAIEDIQAATDLFQQLFQDTGGGDGYVSLEVSPYLANDTEETMSQVKKLWQRVNRPNFMIKIPATKAGISTIKDAIAAGINVNVTLIFSLQCYAEVMDAYLKGLEELIGPDTVNTVPPQTLVAFLDHGQVRLSLGENIEGARQALDDLETLGISMREATRELEEEGVASFSDAYTTNQPNCTRMAPKK